MAASAEETAGGDKPSMREKGHGETHLKGKVTRAQKNVPPYEMTVRI